MKCYALFFRPARDRTKYNFKQAANAFWDVVFVFPFISTLYVMATNFFYLASLSKLLAS